MFLTGLSTGGVAYTHLITVLTYNFDENALLGHVCRIPTFCILQQDPTGQQVC